MEIPMEFNINEEKNTKRKSDIEIGNLELEKQTNTSSILSKLFNEVDPSFGNSLDNDKDNNSSKLNLNINDDEIKLSSGNNSLNYSDHTNDSKSIHNLLTQKHFARNSIENIETSWDNNIYKDNYSKINETKLAIDQTINNNEERISKSKEKIFGNIKKTSEENQRNGNNFNSNGKISHDNLEKLKNKTQQKTVESHKVFDKAKLLAAMKAIDDNENVDFIQPKIGGNNVVNKFKITENLYRGIPAHSKKKSDIMKELFMDTKLDNNKNNKEY
jgi:hypothetical protein